MNAFGDFQTPPALAHLVVDAIRERGIAPHHILEPTCGSGTFLAAASAAFPQARRLIGIEYQAERYREALAEVCRRDARVAVHFADAYTVDYARLLGSGAEPLLIVGNPPWVTTAALGTLAVPAVQPPRGNPKNLRGLAARTGAANFDVAEYLILALLGQLRDRPLQLALLIKESVARNVLDIARELDLRIIAAEIVRIDARRWFDVSVDACAFFLSTGSDAGALRVPIRPTFGASAQAHYEPPDATLSVPSANRWRAGIKHDAADVFELIADDAGWRNGFGERLEIEATHVFPLIKARELQSGASPAHALIVPQHRLGERTDVLAHAAPRLFAYLQSHAPRLAARKSSIYRRAPAFSIFGVGPYSFAPWKVAVAGFYERPSFRLIGPRAGRPVMLGDTAYFVPFDDEAEARAFLARCQSTEIRAALAARIVRGKRPITKRLLDAIDWDAANESRS